MAEVDPLLGATVGDRYRLVEQIGEGGMATVYRAEHQLLRKPVAVKVLHPELSTDETMAARFEGEAIAAARLEHPNVVSITDFGRTPDGRMFLVMEYLEGTPLADLIADAGRLDWRRAVELTRQTLRGLAHAHDMGVVHRDLKPSNIMVVNHPGGREVAKIIDFGIAKIVSGSRVGPRVETQAGIVFGTADFLAPERLLGKGDSDPRSDIYAAGIILYEALTGERPFHNDDPYTTVQRALAETARPPSAIARDVPPALDAAVLRALEKDPDRRYASPRDLLTALDPLARKSTTGGVAAPASSEPMLAAMAAGDSEAVAPLPVSYGAPPTPTDRRKQRLLLLVPLVAAAIVVLAFASSRGGPVAPVSLGAPAAADPATDLQATVKQAAEGATVEERQRAFDRLVALGYGDRVPWVPMLGRDLRELPTCEQRREVVAKLQKINDPAAVDALKEAAARPDNGCLAQDAQRAAERIAAGEGAAPAPAPAKKRRSGGGGHF